MYPEWLPLLGGHILTYMIHIIKDDKTFNHKILVLDTITIFFVGKFTI